MKTVQKRSVFLVAALTVAWTAGQAGAAVVDLRAKARANPSLMHHYTFEGPHQGPSGVATNLSHDGYLLDRKGELHLLAWKNTSDPVSYGPGIDALSRAATGEKVTLDQSTGRGAAWYTTNAITLPEALTVECVLRPNRKPEVYSGYVVGTRHPDDSDRRGYFLLINTSGKFTLQVGNPAAVSFSDELETNHWYYVVTTFDVTASGATTQTVINAYFADLTADGPLTHALANHTVSGFNARYSVNPSQIGIGCIWNADSRQYPSPASIDEVAIYGSVFSAETIDKHLEALRREMPEVWYREIFPNDNSGGRLLGSEGWACHCDSTATNISNPRIQDASTAFQEDVSPVGSFPVKTGISLGYLNNYGGPTVTNYIFWTEEMTNKVEFAWLQAVKFDTRFNTGQSAHVAIRLDVHGTAADTSDDVWYMAQDFTNAVGTSALAIPAGGSGPWWRYTLDMRTAEWTVLNFTPDVVLEPGTTQAVPPERALITAFGLFHPIHFTTQNARLDNYTLYVRKIYPPLGTLFSLQ